jgi:hypothetical protein
MSFFRNYPALLISLTVHAAILAGMAMVVLPSVYEPPTVVVETVFSEERLQQEFTRELDIDTSVSQTLSLTPGGGGLSGVVGGQLGSAAGSPIGRARVGESQKIGRNTKVRLTSIGDTNVPGLARLGTDLGEGEVSGEVGARVEGYGAAMHRLTQEIVRMMRKDPVIAVWLFDDSISLRDDRKEIRDNFHKIYEELDIARQQASQRNERYAALETMVCSFSDKVLPLTKQPTADLQEIKAAIDRITENKAGVENTYTAIGQTIDQYAKAANRSDRKLAIIVLTDESGDDEETMLEQTVEQASRYKTPVYFLTREAVFGYPNARVRWVDPETGLSFWPEIRRGPETAMPECLQYDGFGGRDDSTSSGFGPYGQARLVKESGGILFMLAGDEQDLSGSGARLQRKFDDIAMKEYEPQLVDRRKYVQSRDPDEFRKTVWDVIVALNPNLDNQLGLRRWHYPLETGEFKREGQQQFERTLRSMRMLNEAVERLDSVRNYRLRESEQRWRAAYDLVYAQCLSYRVRQFQLLLAIDQHGKGNPKPKDPKSNAWDVRHTRELLAPSEQQVKVTKVDMAEIESQRQKALEAYQTVIKEHPGTPWALRAQQEMGWGFGIAFGDVFRDPRYNDPAVQARVPRL